LKRGNKPISSAVKRANTANALAFEIDYEKGNKPKIELKLLLEIPL